MARHEHDWRAWHRAYDAPGSRLARRLAVVQRFIREALDRAPPGPIRVLSLCAGEGRDLFGVLTDHPRAAEATGRLVELDATLATRARAQAPPGIEVLQGDASTTSACEGIAPADLVLACGIFGNIVDDDIRNTVQKLPMLCARDGTVIWTRHPHPPDRTVDIRRWLGEAGFEEVAFVRDEDGAFCVGAHRLTAPSRAFAPGVRLFRFFGAANLPGRA
ncbi:MAG: class I SAM-dependent methyltransferase [Myxococcota bacterium]